MRQLCSTFSEIANRWFKTLQRMTQLKEMLASEELQPCPVHRALWMTLRSEMPQQKKAEHREQQEISQWPENAFFQAPDQFTVSPLATRYCQNLGGNNTEWGLCAVSLLLVNVSLLRCSLLQLSTRLCVPEEKASDRTQSPSSWKVRQQQAIGCLCEVAAVHASRRPRQCH